MKILVVCSYNSGRISPFIKEQVDSLVMEDIEVEYFKITGKGFLGYLKNFRPLIKSIKKGGYDLIHAHYGLSGLLANLQRIKPVITTYHGSDIHFRLNRIFSLITSRLSHFNILTNKRQIRQLHLKKDFEVYPCGIDTELFCPLNKGECRTKFGLNESGKIILFCSSFDRKIKNAELAKKAVNRLKNVSLIELKGYSREQVAWLINASDLVLITSFYETGPIIAKEALACNTPVVSTDVGDVKDIISKLDNCYLTSYNPDDVARYINKVLNSDKVCNGRSAVLKYDLHKVAKDIRKVYQLVLGKKMK